MSWSVVRCLEDLSAKVDYGRGGGFSLLKVDKLFFPSFPHFFLFSYLCVCLQKMKVLPTEIRTCTSLFYISFFFCVCESRGGFFSCPTKSYDYFPF